jgi:hypothetical protein
MGYNYSASNSNIKKNNYSIYIRETNTFENPVTTNQLKAILNDLDSFPVVLLDDASTGANVNATNTLYKCDASSGNVDIDVIANTITGESAGDVIIFKASAIGNIIRIYDEDGLNYKIDYEIGDYCVMVYSGTKWQMYYQQINYSTTQSTYYTKIGACEEKPTIKASQGQSINTSEGDELTVSENLELSLNDLNIDEDNYTFLRSLDYVDICFYYKSNPNGTIFVKNILANSFAEITGNDLNKIVLNAKLESDDVDENLYLYVYES